MDSVTLREYLCEYNRSVCLPHQTIDDCERSQKKQRRGRRCTEKKMKSKLAKLVFYAHSTDHGEEEEEEREFLDLNISSTTS